MDPRNRGLAAIALAALLATVTACGPDTTGTAQGGPASRNGTPASATTTAAAPAGGNDDEAFCKLAKEKGIENLAADSDDPQQTKKMLRNLDELAAAAPADIHADFATFDKVEHALLEPGSGGAQPVTGPEIRGSLTRVAAYLKNTCHITVQDQ